MKTIFDTEEVSQIRDTARKFAQERVAPGYLQREREGKFDRDLLREMGSLGLIAPELPEEFGGMGADHMYSGVIIEEIGRADFTFGYAPLLASLNGNILAHFAKKEIAREWLAKLTAGEIMLSIALTEPKGGSDAANLGLRMERDGDYYILNGEKTSISANQLSAGTVLFARTGKPEDKARGVSAILVPMDLPGITTSKFSNMGQNSVGHGSIWFDNVRVPAEYLLGDEGRGFVQVMQGFDFSLAHRPAVHRHGAAIAGRNLGLHRRTQGVRQAAGRLPGRIASVGGFRNPPGRRAPSQHERAMAEG